MRTKTALASLTAIALAGCLPSDPAKDARPAVTEVIGASDIAVGRYIVMTSGCNDCHTPGYAQSGGKTPEAEWLNGSPVGYRGPWGVTYASNLRLVAAGMPEDDWVEMLQTRESAPPMPWPSVRSLSEANKRALHRYIRSLGPAGPAMPTALPPGVEPTTPYEVMTPVMPSTASPAT